MSKSAVARGASMAASVWSKLDKRVKEGGGTEDAIHILDKPDGSGLLDAIAKLLVEAQLRTRDFFPVTIDYALSLTYMIDVGKYDVKDEDVTAEHFPLSMCSVVICNLILVHPRRNISTEDAKEEIANLGLEPAKIEHLLAFGSTYPQIQREYAIVALGSPFVDLNGDECVPCLDEDHAERRRLNLTHTEGDWEYDDRFLAFHKSQSAV